MSELDKDHDMMMDQCALECMHAFESKDKASFLDAFYCLVADILYKMSPGEGDDDVDG